MHATRLTLLLSIVTTLAGAACSAADGTPGASEAATPEAIVAEAQTTSQAVSADGSTPGAAGQPGPTATPVRTPLPGPETVALGPGEVETGSGLRYEDLSVGDGREVQACDMITFEFTTALTDGTVVESTDVYGVPWTVVYGAEPPHLAPGWDESFEGMRVGGRRKAVVPSELAFGDSEVGRIPPNAALVIDVELLDAVGPPGLDQELRDDLDGLAFERSESGLESVVLAEGEGEPLVQHDMAFVHYVGWLENGTRFDSTENELACGPVPLPVGGGMMIKGWEEALLGMKAGERKLLRVPPELAYGESGQGAIPANATLVFDLVLAGIQRQPANPDRPSD